MRRLHSLAAVFSSLLLLAAEAPALDPICGVWFNQERDARLEIYPQDETFEAKIIWLKEPRENGQPRADKNNPDVAMRERPVMGLAILRGLRRGALPGQFEGGRIYDPKNGRTYDCRATLKGDTLALRGYVLGLPFLGRTTTWTRAN